MVVVQFTVACQLAAQTFENLHSFGDGTDGSSPYGSLVLGSALYGTTSGAYQVAGGTVQSTVFTVNLDGTGFTNLHIFGRGSDGTAPYAGLILSGSTLYGTTKSDGILSYGTLFRINTDGTGYRILHSFGQQTGGFPVGTLVLSGTTLYGTTSYGGGLGLTPK